MKNDYKAGDICQECKKEVLTDGRCDWCAFAEFEARQFQAELEREDPDFSDFYANGEMYI
jgi:hypothetical protein